MAEATSPTGPPRTPAEISHGGPLPLFDHQLKILGDSYITFFADRIKIEDTYVESLRRLHAKSRTIDNYLDDRSSQSSTVRQAWREIRDNVEREADARQAFVSMLHTTIQPLLQLRETQERTRKRIREDIKESTLAHTDYAENTVPRLKRSYFKRCQEVDEHRAASKEAPASTTTTNVQLDSSYTPPQRAVTVTSPSPTRLGGRPSTHTGPRNRSPSGPGGALADLAHQGKKGLRELKGFLDGTKGGAPPNMASGRAESALRGVRAKRDADEADREYRKSIHWLETLRLNRIKILEGGYNSLDLFVRETTETVHKSLVIYVDNLFALAKTNANFAEHASSMVAKISADKDQERLKLVIAPSKALSIPKRVLYENAHFGVCPDICFGTSLVDYATSHGLPEGAIPRIVKLCIAEVEARGLNAEGIYRISGRHAAVQELVHRIERDERAFRFDPQVDDVYCVSSLLKQYLRQLPEPLFRFPLAERMHHTEEREDHAVKGFAVLRSKIRRLPPVHQATLKLVLEHLSNVAAHVATNKMDVKNLAIVFGVVIFGEDELPKGGDVLSLQPWKVNHSSHELPQMKSVPARDGIAALSMGADWELIVPLLPASQQDTVMEDLIIYARDLFDGSISGANTQPFPQTSTAPPSPPLPELPLEEPAPVSARALHRWSHTMASGITGDRKARRMYRGDASNTASSESLPSSAPARVAEPPSSPSHDFAPQFQHGPPVSIHPSRRHGKTPSISTSSQVGSSTGLPSEHEEDASEGAGDSSFASQLADEEFGVRRLGDRADPATITGPRADDMRTEANPRPRPASPAE